MPDPEEQEETQETQQTQASGNGAANAEELAAIKAELEEEKKAIAAAQAMIQEKDKRIAELQASVSVVQQAAETAAADLTALKDAHTRAVARYLDMARALNPTIPGDVIAGATIDDIDASVAKALSIAAAVKASLEAQAKEARVPAGAPARTAINLEGLSPREKIAAGLSQKGGT